MKSLASDTGCAECAPTGVFRWRRRQKAATGAHHQLFHQVLKPCQVTSCLTTTNSHNLGHNNEHYFIDRCSGRLNVLMTSALLSLYSFVFLINITGHYPFELFELGVLEVPQGARVFLLDVTQTCVADLRTHFPDVHQCWSEALCETKMVKMTAKKLSSFNGGFLS